MIFALTSTPSNRDVRVHDEVQDLCELIDNAINEVGSAIGEVITWSGLQAQYYSPGEYWTIKSLEI